MKKHTGLLALFLSLTFFSTGTLLYGAPKSKTPEGTQIPGSKETIQFPEELLKTISSSMAHIQRNDYTQAINEYKKDSFSQDFFNSYKEKFASKKNSSKYIDSLNDSFKKIQNETNKFISLQAELNAAVNSYSFSIKGTQASSVIQSNETKLKNALTDLASCQKNISQEVASIKKIHSDSTDFSTRNEINYPLLLLKYTGGLSGVDSSGILGTINSQFDYIVSSILAELINICDEDSRKIQTSLPRAKLTTYPTDFQEANKIFPHLIINLQRARNLENFFSLLNSDNPTERQKLHKYWETSIASALTLADKTQLMLSEAANYAKEAHRITTLEKSADPINDFRNGKETYSSSMVKAAASFSDIGKKATAAKNEAWLNTYSALPEETRKWDSAKNSYLIVCNELINASSTQATKTWILLANYYSSIAKDMVQSAEKATEKFAQDKSHPTASIKELTLLASTISEDSILLKKFQSYLDEGYQYRTNFVQQRKDITESESKLAELSKTTENYTQEATNLRNIALAAKSKVDLYYSRAVSNFNSGDYSLAHTNLDRANSTYTQELENLRKDEDIREESYQGLLALRQDFIERERPILVNEIRQYKNSAKNYYYTGEFEQANATLTKAETRRNEWAKLMDTTLESDDELQRIKEMVNTALSIKEGRIIYPEDPLYAEMSQLLSIAIKYFNTGNENLSNGKKSEGEKYLSLAKDKVNEIKLIYPRNQEASILSLKIDQLLDKTAFDQMFKDKIASYKKINFAQRDVLAMDSYNDLLDLYEINPAYQGLKAMIQSIEIDLGIRQKPVSNTNIQKAQSLAQESKKLLDSAGRDESLLAQAKEKANASLALNQNNDLAIQVLDEIALRSGSTAAVVLSAKDEEKYQAAVKDLQMNNIFSAKQKIDELLSNPSNKRSAKIIKLQKRVEALL